MLERSPDRDLSSVVVALKGSREGHSRPAPLGFAAGDDTVDSRLGRSPDLVATTPALGVQPQHLSTAVSPPPDISGICDQPVHRRHQLGPPSRRASILEHVAENISGNEGEVGIESLHRRLEHCLSTILIADVGENLPDLDRRLAGDAPANLSHRVGGVHQVTHLVTPQRDLDLALFQTAGADDDSHRDADQIGVLELDAGDAPSGRRRETSTPASSSPVVEPSRRSADTSASFGSSDSTRASNGASGTGQMMPSEIVVLLHGRSQRAADAEAVAAHHHRLVLAVLVGVDSTPSPREYLVPRSKM